ncbi:MAG: helix-turn-helix domain-containing protein [Anaerolineales bacterium]|nr:helix-turn-helix domain-containing protein [Anaerolineales bacterium]
MKKQHLHLSEGDRTYLENWLAKANCRSKSIDRPSGCWIGSGKTYTAVAETLGVNLTTVSKLAQKYQTEGLACLQDQARSGRPSKSMGFSGPR